MPLNPAAAVLLATLSLVPTATAQTPVQSAAPWPAEPQPGVVHFQLQPVPADRDPVLGTLSEQTLIVGLGVYKARLMVYDRWQTKFPELAAPIAIARKRFVAQWSSANDAGWDEIRFRFKDQLDTMQARVDAVAQAGALAEFDDTPHVHQSLMMQATDAHLLPSNEIEVLNAMHPGYARAPITELAQDYRRPQILRIAGAPELRAVIWRPWSWPKAPMPTNPKEEILLVSGAGDGPVIVGVRATKLPASLRRPDLRALLRETNAHFAAHRGTGKITSHTTNGQPFVQCEAWHAEKQPDGRTLNWRGVLIFYESRGVLLEFSLAIPTVVSLKIHDHSEDLLQRYIPLVQDMATRTFIVTAPNRAPSTSSSSKRDQASVTPKP